jgi:hypothetical protein
MGLRQLADIYGGIPFFIILILYFYSVRKTPIVYLLLVGSIVALLIDVYLSFIYEKKEPHKKSHQYIK